ncbi:MAG: hypothetical protein NDI63_06115 [Pseudobdellovibrio sp.]|nr:hypothetical protein [Pseudobdellovibrio sp.]
MKLFAALLSLVLPQLALADKPQLPFVFLNQYIEYDVSEGKILNIGGHKIDWNDDFATIKDGKLLLKKQEILLAGIWNITVKNPKNKVVFTVKEQDLNALRTFPMPASATATLMMAPEPVAAPEEVSGTVAAALLQPQELVIAPGSTVCLSTRNQITQYLMCKSLTPMTPLEGYPQVEIAKKKVNPYGRLILNQPKKSVLFDVKINELESIKLTTRKRLIIPSTVKKNVARKDYQIKFIDVEMDNYSWETNVGYEQEAFKIPNDNLVTAYQDYFNKDNSNKELDLTYYVPPYKRMKILNMYSISPFFGFSRFEGNTRTKNVSILSEYDISLRTYIMKQMPKEQKYQWFAKYFHFWTASANFRSIKYVSNVNSVTVANPQGFLYNLSGSVNRAFSDRISYAIRAAVEKNTAVDYNSNNSAEVNMSSVLNKELGVQGSLNMYDRGRFVSFLHAGYAWLLPTDISGSQSKMGTRAYFRTDLHYADGNKLYGIGFHYNLRNQETQLQKLKDQSFDYTASYSVAF